MKRLFAIILTGMIIISTSEMSHAQEFGIYGGTNYLKLYTDNGELNAALEPNFGFQLGGYVQIDFGKIAIRAEPGFALKSTSGDPRGNSEDLALQLEGIQLPVLLQLGSGKLLRWEVGGFLSYIKEVRGVTDDLTIDLRDLVSRDFEAGLMAGVRLRLVDRLDIRGRYMWGLADNSIDNLQLLLGLTGDVESARIRGFTFGVSYALIK